MKEFFIALKDNLSNIFSIIGIGLTVYFAVFYVPNYVQEIEIKKIESTHESLIESIQELVYNNHDIDSEDIDTLIRGKELSGQLSYPYTSEELLIQVQDRFLDNKFIPLDQRKSLIEKIDTIREALPISTVVTTQDDKPNNINVLYSWISGVMGILAALLGSISIWSRSKKLEEIKIESTIEDRQESIKQNVHTSILMERNMYETLKDALGQNHVEYCPPSTPVDFIIKMDGGKDTGVEVKYTETEIIPLRVVHRLIDAAIELDMPLVLISNAELTANANKLLKEYNLKNKDTPISHLNIDQSKDVENDIKKLFKQHA
ncbi:MAG: hypothetical protein AB2598_20385 [Candidatus Thiodiazotropha sp.]